MRIKRKTSSFWTYPCTSSPSSSHISAPVSLQPLLKSSGFFIGVPGYLRFTSFGLLLWLHGEAHFGLSHGGFSSCSGRRCVGVGKKRNLCFWVLVIIPLDYITSQSDSKHLGHSEHWKKALLLGAGVRHQVSKETAAAFDFELVHASQSHNPVPYSRSIVR